MNFLNFELVSKGRGQGRTFVIVIVVFMMGDITCVYGLWMNPGDKEN